MTATAPMSRRNYIVGMTVIAIFFFIFGFLTWLNGILIPFLRTACELTDFQAYFVTTAFYISYFVMSLPSSALLKKTGFKNGMSIGLWVMAVGALDFHPCRSFAQLPGLPSRAFCPGNRDGTPSDRVNPYVTIIGPRESAAKRISMMGIANKFAGAIAPIIIGAHILKDSHLLDAQLAAATDAAARGPTRPACNTRDQSIYYHGGDPCGPGLFSGLAHLPEVDTDAEEPSVGETNVNKIKHMAFPPHDSWCCGTLLLCGRGSDSR